MIVLNIHGLEYAEMGFKGVAFDGYRLDKGSCFVGGEAEIDPVFSRRERDAGVIYGVGNSLPVPGVCFLRDRIGYSDGEA